jgi:hypothetical protein
MVMQLEGQTRAHLPQPMQLFDENRMGASPASSCIKSFLVHSWVALQIFPSGSQSAGLHFL